MPACQVQDVGKCGVGYLVAEYAGGVADCDSMFASGIVIDGVHPDTPADENPEIVSTFKEFAVEFVVTGDYPNHTWTALEEFGRRELLACAEIWCKYFETEILDPLPVMGKFDLHLAASNEHKGLTHVPLHLARRSLQRVQSLPRYRCRLLPAASSRP